MKTLRKPVVMDPTGRLTIPAEARHSLHLNGETEFLIEIDDEKATITFRPALTITVAREDAWAYTPAHRERLARALAEVEQGKVIHGSEVRLGIGK